MVSQECACVQTYILYVCAFVSPHRSGANGKINIGNNEQNEGRDDVGQRSKQRVSDCQKNEQKSSFEISQLFIKEEQPSTSISFYPEKTESVLEPSMDIKETIIIKQEEGTTSSFLSQNEYDNNQEDVTSFLDNTTKGTSTDKHLSSEGQESNDEEDVNDCTDVIIKNEPQSPVSRSEDGDQGIMGDTDDLLGNQKSDKAIQVNVKPRMKSVSIQTGPIVCECCLKLKK
ncbi:uncharacterized protein LOC108732366 isoform X2 [Agrilus planipennis]|uniref:Uncharacterized protein LOC108732366 isoform X2 n=1 Tax=Agrilus planipennis TaxID=224129 RepID=A0A1W4W3A2_AGRPL|nr:uncharacterized protein LOC108732366 isoform X2 [Agrilus planipennis]